MGVDSFTSVKINRSRCEIRLHNPEACFYLPPAFADFQDIFRGIIKQIGTYRVKAVISGLIRDFFFIKII